MGIAFQIKIIAARVKNLIRWFPVIWKDEWWDYSFLLEVLRLKLKTMEEGFRKKGIHVHHVKEAKNIKICILLLDRIINEIYWEQPDFPELISKSKKTRLNFNYLEKQDIELLFKILNKQIMCWWD